VALEDSWLDVDFFASADWTATLKGDFAVFLENLQHNFKVLPEFKVVVGDMQSALMDLRRWLEQVELGIRSQPGGSREDVERKIITDLFGSVAPVLAELFERFNVVAGQVPENGRAEHAAYAKRQLHPLVLCAPFMYRTFTKPLGFAGDYEMVNMMRRDPYQGGSVFAKVLNAFFLSTPPVIAHRNRLEYLREMLIRETSRVARAGKTARIFNLGCGPATEVQDFLATSELSQRAEFVLLDFNDETVLHTDQALSQAKAKCQRTTNIRLIKKSVAQLLREAAKPVSKLGSGSHDFVYCAGLFDYMPDHVCQKLMEVFYDLTAPGGVVLVTNVDVSNPSRNWMEYMVDWHLAYRSGRDMEAFRPPQAPADQCRAWAEPSGVNVFFEVRRPPQNA
jgi:extracellular factor (EF) 3-hydroxypalmitic acid methyl ester biosynthesis protein